MIGDSFERENIHNPIWIEANWELAKQFFLVGRSTASMTVDSDGIINHMNVSKVACIQKLVKCFLIV